MEKRSWWGRIGSSLIGFFVWSTILFVLVASYAFLIEPRRVKVESVTQELPVHGDAARQGAFRIAFVSDFDMTRSPGSHEEKVVRAINALEPDLIAVGGDFWGGDEWQPSDDQLADFGAWLGSFRARYGTVAVWGEQELAFRERLVKVLVPEVRDLQDAAEIHPAGAARLRIVGPDGIFAPMSLDPSGGGHVVAGWGKSLTLAEYHGTGSERWSGLDLLVQFRFADVGDGPGIALFGKGGYRLRVVPGTLLWGLVPKDGDQLRGVTRAKGTFLLPRVDYLARVRLEPGDSGTKLRSRVWPADQKEPSDWTIDLVDLTPSRPRQGSVALLAGGSWSGSGLQQFESIEVRDLGGALLLSESFDDPLRFKQNWSNPGGARSDYDATVVIAHSPEMLLGMPHLDASIGSMDLVLAGHTHGGQARLPWFGPLMLDQEFPRGWSHGWTRLEHGRVWLYVTRGIGVSQVPARFLCPPEVTDLQLQVLSREDHR